MDNAQLETALNRLFVDEGHRLVFWNDPQEEFVDALSDLQLPDGVSILRLDHVGSFEVKNKLEREDTTGRYLLYSPTPEPDYDDDWLLDIRLYSRSFRADRASIILDQLGLKNQQLRDHIAARRKFFDSKERLHKLQPLVEPDDAAVDLDRKMIAVAVKSDQPEWFSIVRTVFHGFSRVDGDDEIDLDRPPQVWDDVEKYDLDGTFWATATSLFGYSEENPTLKGLLIRLLVTDFAAHLRGDVPDSLAHLVLPPSGKSDAIVLLAQWRDSMSQGFSYDRLSTFVAGIVNLDDHLYRHELEDLVDVMTFLNVEKVIAGQLRDRVKSTAETIDADAVHEIAARRQDGHWASTAVAGAPEVPRETLHAVYDALVAAADLFALRNDYPQAFQYDDAKTLYKDYEAKLYRFDQLYRHFCEHADRASSAAWDIVKTIREPVEACYVNWYLMHLALAWGKFLDPDRDDSLMKTWSIAGIPSQQAFYDEHVQRRLREATRRRSFVIISDAFRYEIAEELTDQLNGVYRLEAELGSQLGVLPSYTALGMAALLPHRTLSYKPNGVVLVDDQPTSSLEQRGQILERVNGMAIKSVDLLAMKKEEGRELVSDKQVVYIYHNVIDAIGDSASTEDGTFLAARRTIDELAATVRYVVNHLNGNHVLITADHGFLFTELSPGEPEKSALVGKPAGTVIAKKRYLIGRDLGTEDTVWHGLTSMTAGASGDMEFWVPRGANRFHFVGGARFVHGGAMLQEVCVPVITVVHRKGKAAEATATRPVAVHILGTTHKMTTSRHRFQLIQMDAVSDRVKPITLKIAVYEGGEAVSDVAVVTFDSPSGSLEGRTKWVTLSLRDRDYDKAVRYRLVLRDAETDVEHQSVDVTIDRAFGDDF